MQELAASVDMDGLGAPEPAEDSNLPSTVQVVCLQNLNPPQQRCLRDVNKVPLAPLLL